MMDESTTASEEENESDDSGNATVIPPDPDAEARAEAVEDPGAGEAKPKVLVLALTALGVVYGDIGTSPLYALRECFAESSGLEPTQANVFGVLSLILWSLIVVITLKYLVYIMRADNHGEGGVLALLNLVEPRRTERKQRRVLVAMGLFGAALLYGDGMITPAISVLSAIEGLNTATPVFEPYVVPITVVILALLFLVQRRGTAAVGLLFGPVTLVWFAVLIALGVRGILLEPNILRAANPYYATTVFTNAPWIAFVVLGAVFLVVTGGEALYADMGHFGKKPIRLAWFVIVLPGLLVNYFGQGALVIHDPKHIAAPFFHLAPSWATYPLVGIAAAATIIASQAVISGAFSLTRQAVQLGELPRLRIIQTSPTRIGQIYIPLINWLLMIAAIALVVGFGSSGNLAAAYGVAVSTTMVITTVLAYFVATERWRWPRWVAVAITVVFICVDSSFFGANILKFVDGGWVPLVVGGFVFVIMTTWRRGHELIHERSRDEDEPITSLLASIREEAPARSGGTDVFMTGRRRGTPAVLKHHLRLNQSLSEQVVLATVVTEGRPHIGDDERLEYEDLGDGFHRVVLHYGFMDHPTVPAVLQRAAEFGLEIDPERTTYYVGQQLIVSEGGGAMSRWRQALFDFLARNEARPMSTFDLPPKQVVELGVQIEI